MEKQKSQIAVSAEVEKFVSCLEAVRTTHVQTRETAKQWINEANPEGVSSGEYLDYCRDIEEAFLALEKAFRAKIAEVVSLNLEAQIDADEQISEL